MPGKSSLIRNSSLRFRIGRQPTSTLSIIHLLSSEEDWHQFHIEAVASCCTAKFECDTLLSSLRVFRDEILMMNATLQGSACLDFTEGNVKIDAMIDRLGHVFWDVTLRPTFIDSPVLTFRINDDQTSLQPVADEIAEILKAFPPE